MGDNENIKNIYSKIQRQLLYMIPEKWESIYLYASIKEKINHLETGELFFYYFPKGILRKNPINSYEIPYKFNLDEEGYIKLIENLYLLIKKLKKEFEQIEEEQWNSVTIKIEKFHFNVEFYCENYGRDEEIHLIWEHENLRVPLERYTKKTRQIIMNYLQDENIRPKKVKTYTEAMYCNQNKNIVKYKSDHQEFIIKDKIESEEYKNERLFGNRKRKSTRST